MNFTCIALIFTSTYEKKIPYHLVHMELYIMTYILGLIPHCLKSIVDQKTKGIYAYAFKKEMKRKL